MKNLILLALVFSSVSCTKDVVKPKEYFKDIKGCFLLYNMKSQTFDKVIGEANCHERFPPASTFKVPLAVMAFDSGVLKDENQILKWNGIKESRVEANRDHNAETWMRDSIVWFSQRLTPKMGEKKFQKYVNDFDYGNKDLSAGIKVAWITSPSKNALKINAYEQAEFMKKLWTDKLPASKRSMEITREITYLETSPKGFRWSGKTGSNFFDKDRLYQLGWFISHLQSGDQEFITVTNISDLKPFHEKTYGGMRAKAITKEILTDEGIW